MNGIEITEYPRFPKYVVITQVGADTRIVGDIFVKKSDIPRLIEKLSEFKACAT